MSFLQLGRQKVLVNVNATATITTTEVADGLVIVDSSVAQVVVILPTNALLVANLGAERTGRTLIIKRAGGFLAAVTAGVGNTIDGVAAGTQVNLPVDNDSITLMLSGTEWQII